MQLKFPFILFILLRSYLEILIFRISVYKQFSLFTQLQLCQQLANYLDIV